MQLDRELRQSVVDTLRSAAWLRVKRSNVSRAVSTFYSDKVSGEYYTFEMDDWIEGRVL